MTRQTPLPLLRNLASGVVVSRCEFCGQMVLGREQCADPFEANACPPRAQVDGIVMTSLPDPVQS